MNKTQRKTLAKLALALQAAKDNGLPLTDMRVLAEDTKSQVEYISEEEQDKYDNLSEGLQASEKGEAFEQAIQGLNDIVEVLDSIVESKDGDEEEVGELLDEVIDQLGSF